MKRLILSALLLGALVAQPIALWAKDATAPAPAVDAEGTMKPVAVLAIESYDDLLGDIGFIGQLSNNADLAQQLDGTLKLFTQGQGVNGLDTKRPLGVALYTDGVQFQPLAFLPVVSLKQLLTSLGPIIGEAKPNGDFLEVRKNNRSLFLKEAGGWAFIAQSPDGLASLPKDPGAAPVGSLTKNYDVALRLNVQNIPELYRELVIGQLKATVQAGMDKEDGESAEEHAARQKMVTAQIDELSDVIKDTDQLTLGWNLDRKTTSTFLDLQFTTVPGSKAATQLSQSSPIPTAFSGFLMPNAALTFNGAGKVPADAQTRIGGQLDVAKINVMKKIDDSKKDEDQKELARSSIGDLIDVLKKTIASGKMDIGGAVLLDQTLSAAIGAYVADPVAVEKVVKKLAAAAEKNLRASALKVDADKVGGVRFHTLSIPVPDQNTIKVLGNNLDIAVGIGAQQVYVAIGPQGLPTLKAVIDKSPPTAEKQFAPFQLNAALASILKFVDAKSDAPAAEALAATAQATPGKDHIRVRAIPEKYGITYHLELEEGVLKTLGQASKVKANVQ